MQETTLTKSQVPTGWNLPPFGLLLLGVYVLARGVFVSGMVPPWQGPDEPTHYEYVVLAARERGAPSAFDPHLQAAILRSMYDEGFYDYLGTEPPTSPALRFDAEPRLLDAPSQLGSETPIGYLPFMPLAVSLAEQDGGERAGPDVDRDLSLTMHTDPDNAPSLAANLLAMRRVSVLLSLVMVLVTYGTLRAALGPAMAFPGTGLIAALPMLGFAGSMLNNDPSAAALASIWWWMRMKSSRSGSEGRQPAPRRWLAALILVALLAGLAKRTAIYLLPLALGIVLVDLLQGRRSRAAATEGSPTLSESEPGSAKSFAFMGVTALVALVSLVAMAFLIALFRPHHDRAAGWDRAGDSWGAERRSDAARSGDWGLRIVDASPQRWQFLERWQHMERWQSLDPMNGMGSNGLEGGARPENGSRVEVSVWLREVASADASTSMLQRAQLVINDDAGGYWGETIELGEDWREVSLDLGLSQEAQRFRIALVPGHGTVEGMAAMDADDLRLSLDGRELDLNGGAEKPHRAGAALPAFFARYLDPARLMAATSAGLRDPASALARSWTGLHFLFMSFWGGFGWLSVWPQGAAYYRVAGAISLFGLAAWAIALIRPRWLIAGRAPDASGDEALDDASLDDDPGLRILRECAIASALAIFIAIAGSMAGAPDRLPQGRYLLAAVVPLVLPAILLANRILPRFGPAGLALLVLALDIYAMVGSLWPAYRGGH